MKDWKERLDQARFQIEVAQSFGAEKMLQDMGGMEIGEALDTIIAMMARLFDPTWAEEMAYQCIKENWRCIKLISSHDWRKHKRAARVLVRFMVNRAQSAGEFKEVRRMRRRCSDKVARQEARDPYIVTPGLICSNRESQRRNTW